MYKYKISVIIPIYNSENTIEKCMKSVIQQSFKDIEIIAVNDGSTDNSLSIIEKIAEKDNRIKIFSKKNGGVSNARNEGINNANGTYLFFLDSDDYLSDVLLEDMYNTANLNIDIVCCSMEEKNSTKLFRNLAVSDNIICQRKEEIGSYLFDMHLSSACGKLFKHALIEKYNLRFIEYMKIAEDAQFVYQFILLIENAAMIKNGAYYINNVNPDSLSKNYVENMEATLNTYRDTTFKLYEMYPEYRNRHNKVFMGRDMQLCVMFVNNLFLKHTPVSGRARRNEIYNYLIKKNHISAFENLKKEHYPKNKLEKIYYLAFKSKNITIISLVFKTKEKLKSIIWMRGIKHVHN